MSKPCQDAPKPSLFHEHWWLSAATGGGFSEVELKHGDHLAGRLPFVIVRKRGFRILCMPAFTHLLGPYVNSSTGKPQTRMMNRLSTVRSLIDQLPPFDFFKQAIDPSADDGFALIDGLAFQDRGFQVGHQYTFQVDCRVDLDSLLSGMHFKVRQHIRRAEEKCTIAAVDDPHRFIRFYTDNLRKTGRKSYMQFDRFPMLFSECCARNCGTILAALQSDGAPVAMTYLVWGNGIMYYLMTTRAPDVSDNGSVNLLIWSAMKRAHELGLLFDLDGVTTSGTARFLSGFGGKIKTRLIITAEGRLFHAVECLKTVFRGGKSVPSSFS